MTKAEVKAQIESLGIIPGVRVAKPEQARLAAEMLARAGIPVAEITMTVPGAIHVISQLAKSHPAMVTGAGTVLDVETAIRCVDAGAKFITSPGLIPEVVEFALKNDIVVFPGALTPTEVINAWKTGADYVKIFPCAPVGGAAYIKSLKVPLPQIPLIASGGVNQATATGFMAAGATALGLGAELIPHQALELHQEDRIHELARRFLAMVKEGRAQHALVNGN
ncbi:MAG TPA: bifunctional 4-hydroxy-2-oxoglutarate aldolase/2-dehydro-3-deoxy-phosphogluconate aldolase [Bryobacteraceae bacterium]|jgi:2-dehydro-3-deoxyphosphogluconate aldolase/(4S)-4-hydroxy-2-oxoglutarate aldolase|nr:bifunctional 4-hydroxy-2-oxoglutarate aldolase/2-dehydro-3-deoxy-phosphogluconate aldolase [Bryobacteraceae bacterium]